MSDKRIKYFCFLGSHTDGQQRYNSPAADTKSEYIIEVLNRIGYGVDVVSLAPSATRKCLKATIEKRGNNTYKYFASFGKTTSVFRGFNHILLKIQFMVWILFQMKKHEQILIYHSLGYDGIFIFFKKLKNVRIIGDIEEIYQDVSRKNVLERRNEYRFIYICDKYMFPNTTLNKRVNNTNKPNIVCHGIYKTVEYKRIANDDGIIHILYAGTFDPNKGGAMASIKAAQYLNENFHLHITGFGSKNLENNIIKEVERMSSLTKCKITFHGYLNDAQFLDLMHNCSIGLCTQNPTSPLNITSFPSKILNYMANGLVVLSGRNAAIEESAVADLLYYYDKQEPKSMADAIMNIKEPDGVKGIERLKQLDFQFENELKLLL